MHYRNSHHCRWFWTPRIKTITTMGVKGIQYLTLCLAVCISVGDARAPKKIVNGYYAGRGQFPYQVSLQERNSHFCGGVIIDKTHILTAAHCVVKMNVYGQLELSRPIKELRVITGVIDNEDRSNLNTFTVSNVFPHSFTPSPQSKNDIAILQLAHAIPFNDAQHSIALPSHDLPVGAHVTISGWGSIDNKNTYIRNLTYLDMVVLNQQECQLSYRPQIIHPEHLCVSHKTREAGTCYGDSGGPLTYGNELVGVASFLRTNQCGYGFADGFTRVSAYVPWIIDVLQRHP